MCDDGLASQVLVMLLEFLIEEHILLLRHICNGERGLLDSVDQTIKMKVRTITLHEYEAVVIKDQEIDACLLFAEGLTTGLKLYL